MLRGLMRPLIAAAGFVLLAQALTLSPQTMISLSPGHALSGSGEEDAPVISEGGISQSALPLFGKQLTVTVNGRHFKSNSEVWINGIPLHSTFVSESRLDAVIPDSMMMSPGTLPLQVMNTPA